MTFKTIHTNYGLQRMAQAEATGAQINIAAVSVGDGGGNATTPDPSQTQLVRELFRTAPNRVYQDPTNKALFTVEMIVPATVGGFTIREISAWDDQGSMFALANTPDTYKPQGDGSEGSFSDTVIRMQFLATNASIVSVMIDPNVAVATQQWALNAITVPYLLPGGTTGQILSKKSNADGDVVWEDPNAVNVVVSVVEETQTLAASQTAVILTKCTTTGLAVYIAGSRLRPDQWTPNATDPTKLTLGQSYAAGTMADFVQNEPAAWTPTPLVQQQNLSDVPDKTAARTNLNVYSKSETDQKMPTGGICYFPFATAPAGWLKCNGAAISRAAYASLFAMIGTTFGVGDGFNTFNLPDLRGEFIRGFDDGRGADGGRVLGSAQAESFRSHNHTASTDTQGSHAHAASTDTQGAHAHGGGTSGVGDHIHTAWTDAQGDHAHTLPNNGSVQAGSDNGGAQTPVATGFGSGRTQAPTNNAGAHSHNVGMSGAGSHSHSIGTDTQGSHAHNVNMGSAGSHAHNVTIGVNGGTETRPRNVAFLACIKY